MNRTEAQLNSAIPARAASASQPGRTLTTPGGDPASAMISAMSSPADPRRHRHLDALASTLSQVRRLAQRLLETSDLPIAVVTRESGLGSPDNLRKHFSRALRTTPQADRRTFLARGLASLRA
jgi:hypothetical protein